MFPAKDPQFAAVLCSEPGLHPVFSMPIPRGKVSGVVFEFQYRKTRQLPSGGLQYHGQCLMQLNADPFVNGYSSGSDVEIWRSEHPDNAII